MGLEDFVKKHIVDSTAILASSHPVFCAWETVVSGMTVDESLHARLLATGLVYGGLGFVYAGGRDLWKWAFNVGKAASESRIKAHDFAYGVAYNIIISPIIYRASGLTDWTKIAIASVGATALGATAGPLFGYAIDAFRECAGINEPKRLPLTIQQQTPGVKKGIALATTVLAAGAMVGIYAAVNAYRGQ